MSLSGDLCSIPTGVSWIIRGGKAKGNVSFHVLMREPYGQLHRDDSKKSLILRGIRLLVVRNHACLWVLFSKWKRALTPLFNKIPSF